MLCCRKSGDDEDNAPYKPAADKGSKSKPDDKSKSSVVVAEADITDHRLGRLPQSDALSTIEEKSIVESTADATEDSRPSQQDESPQPPPHSSIVDDSNDETLAGEEEKEATGRVIPCSIRPSIGCHLSDRKRIYEEHISWLFRVLL